jgi:hypothetical protein
VWRCGCLGPLLDQELWKLLTKLVQERAWQRPNSLLAEQIYISKRIGSDVQVGVETGCEP